MSKIGLLCIDWDGTLADSQNIAKRSFKKALESIEVIIDDSHIDFLLKQPNALMPYLKDQRTQEKFYQVFEKENNSYKTQLMPGAYNFLTEHDDFYKCIVTNGNKKFITDELKNHNIEHLIDYTYTADAFLPKPHPDMILRALYDTQIAQSKSWMIGDSESDRIAAFRANISFILVEPSKHNLDTIKIRCLL